MKRGVEVTTFIGLSLLKELGAATPLVPEWRLLPAYRQALWKLQAETSQ
jgi:hypothetical protein